MKERRFVYVSYIATTPEKLWRALTDGAFTRQYWFGSDIESTWAVGAPLTVWRDADHTKKDIVGEVLEAEAPRHLVYTFSEHIQADPPAPDPEFARLVERFGKVLSEDERRRAASETPSCVSFTIEPSGAIVKLTLIHDRFDPAGKTFEGISNGWPAILSSLKSLLESGAALDYDER